MIHWVNLALLKCLFISQEHTLSLLGLHHVEYYPELTARRALPQTEPEREKNKALPILQAAFCNSTDVSLALTSQKSFALPYKYISDTSHHFGTRKHSITLSISSLPPTQQSHPSLFQFPFPEKSHLWKDFASHQGHPANIEWVNPLQLESH